MKITAHSMQQYNKWKTWLNGDIKECDMYGLAVTYINDFYGYFGFEKMQNESTENLFNEFAKIILPPK